MSATKTTTKATAKKSAKKAANPKKDILTRGREAAAVKAAAKKAGTCAKCGKPQEVIDIDHATKKVTYGCPACDGDRIAEREAERKAADAKAAEEREAARTQAEADAAARAAEAQAAGTTPAPKPPRAKPQMSGLDAAHKVLVEEGKPMNAKDIANLALGRGYWATTGATPHATLYAAMLREVQAKGAKARFVKADRGQFAANTTAEASA